MVDIDNKDLKSSQFCSGCEDLMRPKPKPKPKSGGDVDALIERMESAQWDRFSFHSEQQFLLAIAALKAAEAHYQLDKADLSTDEFHREYLKVQALDEAYAAWRQGEVEK